MLSHVNLDKAYIFRHDFTTVNGSEEKLTQKMTRLKL